MGRVFGFLLVAAAVMLASADATYGQSEEMCAERGINPGIDSPVSRYSVIYGRVNVKRPKGAAKVAAVVVKLRDGRSSQQVAFEGSGSYCFEKSTAGGEVSVHINGEHVESRSIIASLPEQREDFSFRLTSDGTEAPPGVVSAKFSYKRSGKNEKLFEKARAALADPEPEAAMKYLTSILSDDPADYIAGATMGSIHYGQKRYPDAETWFKRSVDVNPEFTPAWISLSQSQYAQEKFDSAIDSIKKAINLEATSASAFYILGESYLRIGKGSLAAEALNEAIKLDPIKMAECHLILADLYNFNGEKKLAAKEYRAFLEKVPKYPNKQKIEQYLKDNPPE